MINKSPKQIITGNTNTSLAAEAAEAAGLKLFFTVFKEFPRGNGVLAIFIQYFLNPKDYFNSTPDQMN
jgi:hypothetical protein